MDMDQNMVIDNDLLPQNKNIDNSHIDSLISLRGDKAKKHLAEAIKLDCNFLGSHEGKFEATNYLKLQIT